MKIDTFVCNTCNKAIDVPANNAGINVFPRCVVTKNCKGTLGKVNKLLVADDQYHNAGTSTAVWTQQPLIYNHTQTAKRRTWIIPHDLGAEPLLNVYVYDLFNKLVQIDEPEYTIKSNSPTEAVITFTTNYSGMVQCIGRQSVPSKVKETSNTNTSSSTLVSANVSLVIATRVPGFYTIDLSISTNPSQPNTIVTLSSSMVAQSRTPWSGVDYVIIGNQRYNVVAFDTLPLASYGATTFFVSRVGNGAPVVRDSYILLTNSPHEHEADRILNNVVDLASLTSSNQPNTSLSSKSMYCSPKLISTLYPSMKVYE